MTEPMIIAVTGHRSEDCEDEEIVRRSSGDHSERLSPLLSFVVWQTGWTFGRLMRPAYSVSTCGLHALGKITAPVKAMSSSIPPP